MMGELLRQNGWSTVEALDGETGLALAKAHRPDVILCDLLMAPLNGFQVCAALRKMKPSPRSKIIVISGRDFESDRHQAREAGADAYFTKPVLADKFQELLAMMDHGLQPGHADPNRACAETDSTLRLRFWGVRGSIPTPGPSTIEYGGNTSCIEVRAGGQIVILDAGTGLRLLGRELLSEFGEKPLDLVLLLTHTHWDHIQGLPFFMPVYREQNHLRILGYEGARNGLHGVLSGQMERPFFPVPLGQVPANIQVEELKELVFRLGEIDVSAYFANHPGMCVGYRLSTLGRSIAFFPDNELRHPERCAGRSPEQRAGAMEFARQENEKLAEFVRGTDVLIMDTQYDREEYKDHLGWGHACLDEVVALAIKAEVKQLFLFHHDPDHDDAKIKEMTAHARKLADAHKGSLKVDAAREGLTVELPAVHPEPEQRAGKLQAGD
jgi:phosphoribosyl 1,2-cyclic phosphodiesterase